MGLRVGGEKALFPDVVLVHWESTSDNDIFEDLLNLKKNAQITYIFDPRIYKIVHFPRHRHQRKLLHNENVPLLRLPSALKTGP